MKMDSLFSKIKSTIQSGAGANLSIGNPSKIGDVSVVPVARVSFMFGGGAGKSPNRKQEKKTLPENSENPEETPKNEGFGGGGSVKTDPVGIYLIKNETAKFYPIISVREIVTIFSLLGLLLLKIYKLKRKR
ncbi:MAG: GerW family sporulation protein [Candidatus Cloacimonetes bacterium]|nr:GerW family sporulation protein [Candidatus Cloacimonadota bacterium]MDD4559288.1 GerW family sporulation protein [Candidatus Cloacimonadota bacterium]